VLQVAEFLETICRLPVCISFMQTPHYSHCIPWKYARVVAGFVAKWQQVAISYKLLMQRNTFPAAQNLVHK
jgi:hypothetical protein